MVKKHISVDAKHLILTQYSPHQRGSGFGSLASRFGVAGGAGVIHRWYQRWNGTAASLKESSKSGRPRILNGREVTRYVELPIRRKNRSHVAVHYPELRESVQLRTGKNPSLRTIRRYGKEERGIRQKRTKKQTENECELIIQQRIRLSCGVVYGCSLLLFVLSVY